MNYDNELKQLISKLDYIPKLLLHSCCGPCSTYVIEYLTKYFDITILYYNPNIEPIEEYNKRKEEQIKFINKYKSINKLEYMDIDYDNEAFKKISVGYENIPENGIRCHKCYQLRMEKTCILAKNNNYDFFGTTLTVSPYKNSKIINEIGINLEKEYNIKYLISDFKKNNGYLTSIKLSKDYELYRQNYCGCLFSLQNTINNKK